MSNAPNPETMLRGDQIDQICDEFKAAWLRHQPTLLEELVRNSPEPMRSDLFKKLLTVEIEYRRREGRPLSLEEAQDRFHSLGPWAQALIQEVLTSAGTATVVAGLLTLPERSNPGPQESTSAELPEQAGGYCVVRELGRGGMGVVYLVDDPLGRRQLAVKMMRPDRAADSSVRERFLREARSASAVEHDNVVPIYQVGVNCNTPFLVMPFLKGESLEERLQRDSHPPLDLVFKVGREIALGLSAAHEKGLVHRDVKPGNAWLEGDPKSPVPAEQVRRVKVLDFGLARTADGTDRMSVTGSVAGTPAYMAPEQARGEEVDGRADLFSLGAILYRMSTGRLAFDGPTITAVLTAIATHNPLSPIAVNPLVPLALSTLIEQLLEKQPGKRPASARAVAVALSEIENGQSLSGSIRARRKWLQGVGGVLLVCATAVVAWSLFTRTKPNVLDKEDTKGTESPTGSNTGQSVVTQTPRTETFRVKSIDVKHFAKTPEGDVPRGILGRESFSPLLGDHVQVVANLSSPGYAYIIAFRPDGVMDLCFPNEVDAVPPLTDTPRYPAADSLKAYGLREGTGLWVFAVVASEYPLPPYNKWLAKRKISWHPAANPMGEGWTGLVWWYEGNDLVTSFAGGGTQRGKDEVLTGHAATVRSLGRSLGQIRDTTIGILGFSVGERN